MKKNVMTILLTTLFIATIPEIIVAQPEVEWQQTYSGEDEDHCSDLIQTNDAGFLLVGYNMSFGDVRQDAWAVKTDENGDSLWSREYGGEEGSGFLSVIQTEDGGYLFAGHSQEFGRGQLWLLKTDEEGEEEWSATQDLLRGFKSLKENEEGFLILGYEYVGVIDREGDMLWLNEITGEAAQYPRSIIETGDGGYAMAGRTEDLNAQRYDGILVKLNEECETEWYELHGGRQNDYIFDLVQMENGGFAIVGSTLSFDRGSLDGWLVLTNEEGEFESQIFFITGNDDWMKHVMTTEDNGLIICGYQSSSYA